MMAYEPPPERPPFLPDILFPRRKTGRLLVALQQDAGPQDVLAAVLQAALVRAAFATAAQPASRGSVGAQRRTLRDLRRRGAVRPGDVEGALLKARAEARASAPRLLRALGRDDWRPWPFMLSSTERAAYLPMA